DWPLLYHECRRNGLNMLSNPILDTKALFSYLFPEIDEIISTDFLLSFFSIDASDLKRHTALDDSFLIKRIFDELLKELEQRNIDDIIIDQPITIKRVKLPKLASP
ncbi:MAG TPA: hypothetical protein VNM49_11635, partial [Paenibacillus cookii]|nr:hypothetical protein [Paenibacillus cookii]